MTVIPLRARHDTGLAGTLRWYSAHQHFLPANEPPIDATGAPDADVFLAAVFRRLCEPGSDDVKAAMLRLKADAQRRIAGECFADAHNHPGEVFTYRGVGRVAILIADTMDKWADALSNHIGGTMQIADNVEHRVRKIVAYTTGRDPDRLALGDRFVEDLLVDSLESVEIVMATEDDFELEITDDEAFEAKTVAALIELVGRKVQGSATAGAA